MPTSLLLHFNGSNTSTTFTDSSSNALSVTGDGNAQLSTAQFKFGTASALFDGNGDSLQLPSSSVLDFGTGQFTIEFFMRTNGAQDAFSSIISRFSNAPSTGGTSNFEILNYGGSLTATVNTVSYLSVSSATVNDGNWHHVAVSRSGINMWLGVDGTIVASSSSLSAAESVTISSGRIGRSQINNGTDNNYNGYLDEFRVTKGAALYTAAYTVPTVEFSKDVEFSSREGDLETLFVTDYAMIDEYASTGSLWLWGNNGNGRLGDNATTHRSSPVQTVSAGTNWKLVAGVGYHTTAIHFYEAGKLYPPS